MPKIVEEKAPELQPQPEQQQQQQGQPAPQPEPKFVVSASDWAEAGAKCGRIMLDSVPYIPISGNWGLGVYVPLNPPSAADFCNVQTALVAAATRQGQNALKAFDLAERKAGRTPSEAERIAKATAGANSVLNGSKEVEKDNASDPILALATANFEKHVRAQVAAVMPDASEGRIKTTLKLQFESQAGRDWIANERRNILVTIGTYVVDRKEKEEAVPEGEAEPAVEITI